MKETYPYFQIAAEKPDTWADRSMMIYTDTEEGEKSSLEANVVVSRDTMGAEESFKTYGKRQLKALTDEIPQFDLLSEREGTIDKKPAIDIMCRWMSPSGRVRQRLVFLSLGKGEVATFAATAGDEDFDSKTENFNTILATLSIQEAG